MIADHPDLKFLDSDYLANAVNFTVKCHPPKQQDSEPSTPAATSEPTRLLLPPVPTRRPKLTVSTDSSMDSSDEYLRTRLAALKQVPAASNEPYVKWEDIAGLEDVKRTIEDEILHFRWHSSAETPTPTAILMHGPQGVGKTAIVRSLSHEFGLPPYMVGSQNIRGNSEGESEK